MKNCFYCAQNCATPSTPQMLSTLPRRGPAPTAPPERWPTPHPRCMQQAVAPPQRHHGLTSTVVSATTDSPSRTPSLPVQLQYALLRQEQGWLSELAADANEPCQRYGSSRAEKSDVVYPHPCTQPCVKITGRRHQRRQEGQYHIPLRLAQAPSPQPQQRIDGGEGKGKAPLLRGGDVDRLNHEVLIDLSDQQGRRYDEHYRRMRQRLHQQQPDMWYRALPAYAALDQSPHVMDADLQWSNSRVKRSVNDKGVIIV